MDKEGKIWRRQAGMAALQQILMLVVIGGLALPPLMSLMMTGTKAGQMEERKTKEFYAADAGVTAALWRIKTNYKLDWLNSLSGRWDETVYGHNPAYETYTLPLAPNGNSVVYTIAPKWVLEGLETQNLTQQRTPAENIHVYGNYVSQAGNGKYRILMDYDGNAGALAISRIGCWLPAGLEYVNDSSYLENTYTPARPVSDPQVTDFRGGHTVIWNFSPAVDYNSFYPEGRYKEITFEFTPNEERQGGFCWLRSNISSNYLAWSALNVFEVKSTATSPAGETTRITSYSIRNVGDTFGGTLEGDYYAFGNTLMRDDNNSDQTSRDRLYEKTKFTVSNIPPNAQVERILLYWTGWKCKPWNGLTAERLAALPAEKQVNTVRLTCSATAGGPEFSQYITTSDSVLPQAMVNDRLGVLSGWAYSCSADVTDRVKAFFKANNVDFRGNGTFTVGHWDVTTGATRPDPPEVKAWYPLYGFKDVAFNYSSETIVGWTRYPLGSPTNGGSSTGSTVGTNTEQLETGHPNHAINEGTGGEHELPYAAWSIIIVYSSPSTLGRQLKPFDTFTYGQSNTSLTKIYSGFVVPDLTTESNAARMTCFVGEGDDAYTGDSIIVNGTTLPSVAIGGTAYPSNNVWNSKSSIEGQPITGIDIDTWSLSKTIIRPGDTSATVQLHTDQDQWNLVYMILAFRSKITSGGVFIYDVE